MLGLLQAMALIGGGITLFGRKIKAIKTIGSIIGIIGGVGEILWVINDIYNYFHEEEEES